MPCCKPVDPDCPATAPRKGGKRGAADDAEADDRYVVDGHAGRSCAGRSTIRFLAALAGVLDALAAKPPVPAAHGALLSARKDAINGSGVSGDARPIVYIRVDLP